MTAGREPALLNIWTKLVTDIYLQNQTPVLGTFNIKEIEERAKEVMKDHLGIHVRLWECRDVLHLDATNRSLETTIFGVKYSTPLFVAPIGVQGILHADGELATARAAGNIGVPFIMSTVSSRSIEDVAAANGPDNQRWFQLYWPRSSEITLSLLKRAKTSGFTALVITLDAMFIGWRPNDLDAAYLPFPYGVGVQVGTSDPVFMKRFDLEPRQGESTVFPFEPAKIREAISAGDERVVKEVQLARAWCTEVNAGVFRTWDELKFIRENWDGPILLKGIQHVSDAERVVALGIEGIIVSNHGGRQVDGAIGSLDALDMITRSDKVRAAQRYGKLTVLFDSGIRTGSDIIKALAIGAQGVLLGRPLAYGLAIAGQQGVEQVLRQTICDLHISMGLVGYSDVNEVIGKRDEILTRLEYKV